MSSPHALRDAEQERLAIGAAGDDGIDEGLDGIQSGDKEFVEQAMRIEFAGDGLGFVGGRGGSAVGSLASRASGSKWSFSSPRAR